MSDSVTFKVFRFNPEGDLAACQQDFNVPLRPRMTVLDGLFYILEEQDNTLSFRFACREGVCGSCAMFINGSYRLACQTQITSLKAGQVVINPLPHLPLIKDLVVDMDPFFEKYKAVMPYLKALTAPPKKERQQSQKQREKINEVIDCILCGCCYSACPMTWTNKDYLGPAALVKAYRFVADSRDEARVVRINTVGSEAGIWRCHTTLNCVEACPKLINPTASIQALKRNTLTQKLKLR
ncbi:succinate dehydrogenase iron-sulfur subunit [Chloroflexota bacterium]